jgi:protein-L-isoaspartate(D-aspartate) O-methyltransferase
MFRPALALILLLLAATCAMSDTPPAPDDPFKEAREWMVDKQISARGISDERLLAAMRMVPRHELVPIEVRKYAYADHPLPIGEEQTISQPYIVAYMTEQLRLEGGERVLEIGTGSGYQAAVLAELCERVYSIEIVPQLAERAKKDLKRLGYDNIEIRQGDGYRGWPEEAPFDAIIVTAAPETVPKPLVEQLKVGGRMILPVGRGYQQLMLITRDQEGVSQSQLIPVRFVPMTGEALEKKSEDE